MPSDAARWTSVFAPDQCVGIESRISGRVEPGGQVRPGRTSSRVARPVCSNGGTLFSCAVHAAGMRRVTWDLRLGGSWMRVRVGDVRLHVTVRGDEWVGDRRRPTVVGVHGGPGLDGGFLRFTLKSVSDFAQVVVPDQRGHGRSDLGTPDDWNLDTWADDLAGLIDVLGLHAPVVLGTSFGGFVVQRYLARHPEQPAGAVLIGTGPRAASQAETIERFREVGGDAAAAAMATSFVEASEEAQQDWARYCAPLLAVRPATAEFNQVMQARISTSEVNRHFTPSLHEFDLRPGLAETRCPVLVLVGEQDPLVPPSNAEEAALAVPDGLATVHRVANAAHQVLWDAPNIVQEVLRPFVGHCAQLADSRS